jgi:uncharacterized membrane protein
MFSKETNEYIIYYNKTSCSIVCKQTDQEVLFIERYDMMNDVIKKYMCSYMLTFEQSIDKLYKENGKINSLTMCKRIELFDKGKI